MTLPDRRRTAPGARQGFDLSDLLPANLELSSLKKSDWRKLFERLIAELSRRRGMTTNPGLAYGSMVPGVGMVPMPMHAVSYGTLPGVGVGNSGGSSHDEVKAEADRLWNQARRSSSRRAYTPPGGYGSSARSSSYTPRANASGFLDWGKGTAPLPGTTRDADAFLKFAAGAARPLPVATPSHEADAFLRMGASGGCGGSSAAMRSNDADAFLNFASSGGGGGGGGGSSATTSLASNADAFLNFASSLTSS